MSTLWPYRILIINFLKNLVIPIFSQFRLQILVIIEDRNDNAPEFVAHSVRLSVPENAAVGVALFATYAKDADSGRMGTVRYFLSSGRGSSTSSASQTGFFAVDPVAGSLSLTSSLDYETAQRHTLVITASDDGDPPLKTNTTVFLEVQDVNDNSPVFEQTEYSIIVSESLPNHSQVTRLFHYACVPYVLVTYCWLGRGRRVGLTALGIMEEECL